jgi:hypothetical protein
LRHTDIKIVINEICYNSSAARDTKDWVEIYNAGRSTVNLKNWVISDEGADSGYVFTADYILSPGMYIVVCHNLEAFRSFWPQVTNSTGNMEFGLGSSGDQVNLYDPEGNLVDFVEYDIDEPWPTDVDATGESIELTDVFSDNNAGKNWKSNITYGTPGNLNLQPPSQSDGASQTTESRLSCYPSPFRDYTTMLVEVAVSGKYRIEIFNTQGNLVNTIADQTIEAGEYYIDWNGNASTGAPVPEGVYIVRFSGGNQHFNTRVIRLK